MSSDIDFFVFSICSLIEKYETQEIMKKIILLAIPGIGTQESGFSERFKEDLEKFSKGTPLQNNIRLSEVRPFNVTQIDENQRAMFDRLAEANAMGGMLSLRQFVMKACGDGVTFESEKERPDSVYQVVHNYLRAEIRKANNLLAEHPGSKLVIVGASMGVHVLTTYIWDADNGNGIFQNEPAQPNENLKNLSYLATIGCNIPLFLSGMNETKIKAIDKRNAHFTWDNYYDQDDVLGWPLKQLSPSYEALVTDHEINTGLYVGAHVKYWDDNDFTEPFTQKLIQLHNS